MAGTSCPAGGAPPAQARTPSLREGQDVRVVSAACACCVIFSRSNRVVKVQQHESGSRAALLTLFQESETGWTADHRSQAGHHCESLLLAQAARDSPVAVPAMQLLTALATMRVSWPLVRQ